MKKLSKIWKETDWSKWIWFPTLLKKKIDQPINGDKIYLVDIDGTICTDIKNEQSYLYSTAQPYENSKQILNGWYDMGNTICFFTAREEKDRGVTEKWLKENGFKYHRLIMDKPRIKDGQTYHWIDNRPVKATTYLGNWSELIKTTQIIEVFKAK